MRQPTLVALLLFAACAADPDTTLPTPPLDPGKADGDLVPTDMGALEPGIEHTRDGKLERDDAHIYHLRTFGPGHLRAFTVPDEAHVFDVGSPELARTRVMLYHWDVGASAWELLDDVGQNALAGWSEAQGVVAGAGAYAMVVVGERAGTYGAGWDCSGTFCSAADVDRTCRSIDAFYQASCDDDGAGLGATVYPRGCAEHEAGLLPGIETPAEKIDLCCAYGPFAATAPYCE
jgi:hypothetical protein